MVPRQRRESSWNRAARSTLNRRLGRHGLLLALSEHTASVIPPSEVYALTAFLRERGAEAVAVADLDDVFSKESPLYAKLEAAL